MQTDIQTDEQTVRAADIHVYVYKDTPPFRLSFLPPPPLPPSQVLNTLPTGVGVVGGAGLGGALAQQQATEGSIQVTCAVHVQCMCSACAVHVLLEYSISTSSPLLPSVSPSSLLHVHVHVPPSPLPPSLPPSLPPCLPPCLPQVKLEEIESQVEDYRLTRAFLVLLDSLTEVPLPPTLGVGHRVPGFEPYLEFVRDSVLLRFDSRAYQDPSEKVWSRDYVHVQYTLQHLSLSRSLPSSFLLSIPPSPPPPPSPCSPLFSPPIPPSSSLSSSSLLPPSPSSLLPPPSFPPSVEGC